MLRLKLVSAIYPKQKFKMDQWLRNSPVTSSKRLGGLKKSDETSLGDGDPYVLSPFTFRA